MHCYDWTEDDRYFYILANVYPKAKSLKDELDTKARSRDELEEFR